MARTRALKNFSAELKRRNVYKVAVAYAVVGWLLVQVATQVFPFLEVPNWAIRLVILLIAIGFPIALVIAWAFELTPEGLKRAEAADALPAKGRKKHAWIYIVVIGGAISVALFFAGRYTAGSKTESAAGISSKSIAVLPFESLSEEKTNAYFADGIQDEILTRLAKVADLKVISRTSTQHFKSSPENLPQIAKQLGVMHILEGSVQKANDQVRVNVQLINAMTDAHLWAETYDRKLTDLFAVESEIAKTVADALQAKLTGSEKQLMSKTPTANPEAYELYLKGRFFWNKRTADDLRKSIEYFNQAIARDPAYTSAYAAIAQSWLLLPAYDGGAPKDCFPQGEAAAQKALALDPNSSDAHAALGDIKTLYHFDLPGSVEEFEHAIRLNPNDANAHHWLGNQTLNNMGETERALAEVRRAQELDPLSLVINTNVGYQLMFLGRLDEAIAQLRKTLELDPNFYYARYTLGEALGLSGNIPEAIAEFKKAAAVTEDPSPLSYLGNFYGKSGRRDEAEKILAQLVETRKQRYVQPYNFALVYIGLGDKAKALDYLEEDYAEHDGYGVGPIRVDPMLTSLHGDPRFEALAEKIVPAREFARKATK
jgi:TolB-like protein/Flp pilus assembly protein TadD